MKTQTQAEVTGTAKRTVVRSWDTLGTPVFRTVVGSQAYGTSTPESDTDYKGVYLQPVEELVSFGYVEQHEFGKDDVMYEGRRFLQLLESANPTVLELLFSPDDCVVVSRPAFQVVIDRRKAFLTKRCAKSFGGYAVAQIQKARGLDKKMNWENDRIVRKAVEDFCYVHVAGYRTLPLREFLSSRPGQVGLAKINHFTDGYALYVDPTSSMGYKGVSSGTNVVTSSVPDGVEPDAIMMFNSNAYSVHCREYGEYKRWERERNVQRYVDVAGHGQRIDGKNLLHCRRLIDMALEIAENGELNVRRPNAAYLLSIRRGEVPLDRILDEAEADLTRMDEAYASSGLPDDVDRHMVNDLLLEMREVNGDLKRSAGWG